MPDYLWIQNVVFPLIAMGGVGMLGFGIYRTVNRIIDKRMSRGVSPKEIEALHAEIDAVRSEQAVEIAELYDRLDFTERLLSRATKTTEDYEGEPKAVGR